MPELPEVHAKKRYFDEAAPDQRIRDVVVADSHILKDVSGEAFREQLIGRQFSGSYRRGKYLFAELDNGHHVLLHFGMSGKLHYYREAEERPKYERFRFVFDNGMKLGFDCPRKLARIHYLKDREAFIDAQQLAPDALAFSEEDFLQMLKGKRGSLKGTLLNQKYIAGVGNLYADEMCYQAAVHPASVSQAVPEAKQRELFSLMQEMFDFALQTNADYSQYPGEWLWHHREAGAECPNQRGTIQKERIGGRTSYFVPGWQTLYSEP